MVGRQYDELANAALEPPDGTHDEPVGDVQHRARHRRLRRSGARRRTPRAVDAERHFQPALHHEFVEGGRRDELAVAASGGARHRSRRDPPALPVAAVSLHAVPPRGAAWRAVAAADVLRFRSGSTRFRRLRRIHVRCAAAGGIGRCTWIPYTRRLSAARSGSLVRIRHRSGTSGGQRREPSTRRCIACCCSVRPARWCR